MRSLMIRALPIGLILLLHSPLAFAQNPVPTTVPTTVPQSGPAPFRPSLGSQTPPSPDPSPEPLNAPGGFIQNPDSNVPPPLQTTPNSAPNSAPNSMVPSTTSPSPSVPTIPSQQPQTQTANGAESGPGQGGNGSPQDAGLATEKTPQPPGKLPNKAGQVWREYDISPYTAQVKSTEHPEQAVLDWILRETGTDMWFQQPLGILNADRNHIYVYHKPEIQDVVKRIVDRFVHTRGRLQSVNISLVTIDSPDWRSKVYGMLQPVDVRTPGVEAWMVSKENAARLMAQLSQRGDFKQHSSGTLIAHDGQELVLGKTKPKQFVRSIRWVPNQVPNYQPLLTTIDEGYELKISSLSSLDGSLIEATIKCKVDQVEKLTTVKVDVPSRTPGRVDKMDLQIPQMISWRLHEVFRWPNDQVLLLSCGVVAKPEPQAARPNGLPDFLSTNRTRADALVFIEYRGPASSGQYPNQIMPQSPAGVDARAPTAGGVPPGVPLIQTRR